MKDKSEILDSLRQMLAGDAFAVKDPIELDSKLSELGGWDSFKHISLLMEVEQKFEVELSAEDGRKIQTIDDLVEIISER